MDEARIVSNEWKREKVVVVGGAGERRRRRRGGVFSFHPSGGSLGILSAGWIRNISSCSIRTVSPSAGWPSSIPFLFFFFYLIPFYPSTLSLSPPPFQILLSDVYHFGTRPNDILHIHDALFLSAEWWRVVQQQQRKKKHLERKERRRGGREKVFPEIINEVKLFPPFSEYFSGV